MPSLILKRASVSRVSGEWSDDDYDVLADDVVVGRIDATEWIRISDWRRALKNLIFDHHTRRQN